MKLTSHQQSHLEKGLIALREKRYFDAHEDWEIPWKEMEGDRKLFWQAMIQISVGAYHYTNANLAGCRNLWNKALSKCERILKNGKVEDVRIVAELRDILQDCLNALAQNVSPLPIVENAAWHVINRSWLEPE